MGTANALALELVGAGYGQAADLAADVACGLHLAGSASLGHAEAGSPPNDAPAAAQDNGSSIFSLAASMTGKQQRGADTTVAQLSPAQRVRLLSFAVRLTQDRERLPLLVAELGAAEQAALSPGRCGWVEHSAEQACKFSIPSPTLASLVTLLRLTCPSILPKLHDAEALPCRPLTQRRSCPWLLPLTTTSPGPSPHPSSAYLQAPALCPSQGTCLWPWLCWVLCLVGWLRHRHWSRVSLGTRGQGVAATRLWPAMRLYSGQSWRGCMLMR
jgi:hypothetical protein